MKKKITGFALSFLCALLFAVQVPADAQQPKKVPRIGYLSPLSPSTDNRSEAFRQGLREGLSILCQRKIFVDSITSRAMSLLCLYAQRAKFSLKNRIIPRGKHESAMMISREKKTPLRSNSISNQGRLGWFSGRSKGKKRPVGECKFFRAWPLCRHTEASLKRKPMIRGFSVLLPYRDYVTPLVAIGIYSSV